MIICYDETGRIGLTVNDPMPKGTIDHYTATGRLFIVHDDPVPSEFYFTYYVDPVTRTLTERPVIVGPLSVTISADDEDAFGLTGLPQPCTVSVDDVPYEVDDGMFEFTTPMAADYTVKIDQWPYMPFIVEVSAQ